MLHIYIGLIPIHRNERVRETRRYKKWAFLPTHYVDTGCLPLAFFLPTISLRSQWLRPSLLPPPPSSSPFPFLSRSQLSLTFLRSTAIVVDSAPPPFRGVPDHMTINLTSFLPRSQAGGTDDMILGTRLYR